jgi:hypothetical protein
MVGSINSLFCQRAVCQALLAEGTRETQKQEGKGILLPGTTVSHLSNLWSVPFLAVSHLFHLFTCTNHALSDPWHIKVHVFSTDFLGITAIFNF